MKIETRILAIMLSSVLFAAIAVEGDGGNLSLIRSCIQSCVSELPQDKTGTAGYLLDFGFKYGGCPSYRGLVSVVSNNMDLVNANFDSCATNAIQRLVLLSSGWGGGDEYYFQNLSNNVERAHAGTISLQELKWYIEGSRNSRRVNYLALNYDRPGVSNVVLRIQEITHETNVCQRILSGEAKTGILERMNEICE